MSHAMFRRGMGWWLVAIALAVLAALPPATAAPPIRPMSVLRGLINQAVARHAAKVIIPSGIYRGGPEAGSPIVLPIQSAENLHIMARGVEMVCTVRTRAMMFSNCKNVELDGLTIDYDPLTFTQGKVTAIAPDGNSIDIALDDGYPRRPYERLMLIDPQTRMIAPGMPFFWGSTSAMVGPDVVRVTLKGIGKSARLGMLATLSDGNEPGGVCHGVTIEHCRGGMVLRDVTIDCAPGMGIVEAWGAGGTRLIGDRIVPGPPPPGATQPRLLTTSWDGILSQTLAHGEDVEGCTIEACGDDSWSDQSSPYLVVKAEGTQVVLAGDGDLAPGDHLRRSLSDTPLTVAAVRRVPIADAALDPTVMQRLDKATQYSLWQISHDTVQIVTVDRDSGLAVGGSVYTPDHQGNGFVFRGNTVKSSGRILIKASDGLVEGNTLIGAHNVAVVPEVPTSGAFGIENLTFKNNRVIGAEYTNFMPWSAQAGALCVASPDPASSSPNALAPAGSFRNVTITGNTFENVSATNLWLAGVQDAIVTGNRFLAPDREPLSTSGTSYGLDNGDVIALRNCADVTLSGNQANNPGPYEKTLLSTDATDRQITLAHGGVRVAADAMATDAMPADPLAGWTRIWEWHATPHGKIWRGDGSGPFLDRFVEWGNLRTLAGNQEQEVYVSPAAFNHAGLNCVTYDSATRSLAIRPRVATLAETAVTGHAQPDGPFQGHAILSAMLSLEQLTPACPRVGAWRIVARMPGRGTGGPAYQGAWPAIWLMAHKYPMQDGVSGPRRGDPFYEKHWELDILEQHSRDLSKWYVTDHAQPPFDAAPEVPAQLVATGDTSSRFHEWITIVTDRWWLVYLDRKLILKKPKSESAGHPPLYLIFNLAVGGSWFGNVTRETDFSKWEMNLRSIEIYALPPGDAGD